MSYGAAKYAKSRNEERGQRGRVSDTWHGGLRSDDQGQGSRKEIFLRVCFCWFDSGTLWVIRIPLFIWPASYVGQPEMSPSTVLF